MGSVKVILWVDVETWLPVLGEMDIEINEQMKMSGVIYDFQWDIQVDESEFEPVIPDDFEPFLTDGMKMPKMNEEAAIEGLRLFAEFGGEYPKNLNMMSLVRQSLKLEDSQSAAAEQFRQKLEQAESVEQRVVLIMELMRPPQSLGGFYMMLVQDNKEPVYYGETVGPDDEEAVLMRWKISEGQYRVIFGDLSALDVTAEELGELEK